MNPAAAVKGRSSGALERAVDRVDLGLHYVAALWLFALALIILADVSGRGLFNAPLPGTAEIVANSIVSIAFLQLCHAVRDDRMLRVELLTAMVPVRVARAIHACGLLLGALLFGAVAWASWGPMVSAWQIGEYAGYEGSLRIPVYPVRTLIVAMAGLATVNYLLLAVLAVRGSTAGAAP